MIPPFDPSPETRAEEQRRVALGYITEAWIEAVKDGVDPDHVADAALEAALREMVALRGECETARILDALGPRVTRGDFTTVTTRQ
jgi:hypothetical protein